MVGPRRELGIPWRRSDLALPVLSSLVSDILQHGSGGEQQPAEAGSRTPEDEGGIPDVSSPSSSGSLEAIDRLEEDLNRGAESRAAGYIGKNSEIFSEAAWHLRK